MRARDSLGVFVPALVALLAPSLANAGNGVHPRTPVVWSDVECRTMVDRASGSMWHLDYGIPFEDTEVTEDEVADSRRHQFIAFCRDNSPHDFIPNWVTWADVMAAAEKDLVDPTTITDEQVLETSSAWDGCWFRINADDARLPITTENAEAGVDWDTTGLPAGGYVIHGYTWEPAFNLWVQRPGFVKVIDGDPDAVGPAVAVTTGEIILYQDDTGLIEGCVDALEGSTISASWSVAQDEPEWMPLVEAEPVEGNTFALEFPAPMALAGDSGMIRVDVTDPMDRTTTAYGIELLIVLPMDNPESCNDGGGFVANPGCADSGGSDDASATAGDDDAAATSTTGEPPDATTSGPPADGGDDAGDDGGESCGCTTTPTAPSAMLLGLALIALRRRRD